MVKTDVKQSITIAILGHVHVQWLKRVPHATHLHERLMTDYPNNKRVEEVAAYHGESENTNYSF